MAAKRSVMQRTRDLLQRSKSPVLTGTYATARFAQPGADCTGPNGDIRGLMFFRALLNLISISCARGFP